MKRTIVASALLAFLSICPSVRGSALSTLATSMQPGTWAELTTSNISQTLSNLSGASGTMIVYTDDLSWDPNSQQIFKIGADHLASQGPQFASYTASNNTWQRLTRPSWLSSITFFHGYDHGAIDETHGVFYHRPYSQNVVHRYQVSTQTWSQVPAMPWSDYANCCDALEYFPELKGLVWVSGNGCVYLYKDSTSQWSKITTLAAGSTWQQAEYNPVHKVMVFTIGNRFYKLTSAGQVSQLATPPISLYDGSGWNGVLTVDPVSGAYLILTPTARDFYTYDVTTDTWQAQSSPTKPAMSLGVAATPIASLGVTFFVNCNSTTCHAYLYKHLPGAGVSSPSGHSMNPPGLTIRSLQDVRKSRLQFFLPNTQRVSLHVYNVKGEKVASILNNETQYGSCSAEWDWKNAGTGMYLAVLTTPAGNLAGKLMVLK